MSHAAGTYFHMIETSAKIDNHALTKHRMPRLRLAKLRLNASLQRENYTMNFSFDIEIATKYGVNEAIFLHNIAHWIKFNQASKINFYEGRTWTFNSHSAFTKIFPFWTQKQIRAVIVNCEKKGLLINGTFNKLKYDRTKWYSLTDLGLQLFPSLICPNGQMEMTEWANGNDRMGRPIPNINTNINTDIIIGEDRKSPRVILTPVSDEFTPNKNHELIAATNQQDVSQEARAFIDYYQSHGKKMANWDAAFRNWLRKSAEFKRPRNVKEHPVTSGIRELKENLYKSSAFKAMFD